MKSNDGNGKPEGKAFRPTDNKTEEKKIRVCSRSGSFLIWSIRDSNP